MSTVEVIAAALAAGAGAGLTGTASAAVRDAYAGLKDLLRRRVGDHDAQGVQALEADETEPGFWQARLGGVVACRRSELTSRRYPWPQG